MRYVIIGNGPAAVGAIESIRRADQTGEILLFSKEPLHTYSRPLISYWLLGKTDEERMKYRPCDFYEKNRVAFLKGVEAVKIDLAKKSVAGSDGNNYSYDKLLIATGARPFVPPVPGLDEVKYHTFMTMADAERLRKDLTPESRVLIIGAGLIGLKCAEGILHLVKKVTVVDMASQVLPSIMDADGAKMAEEHLANKGVELNLSDSAAAFKPGEATLKSGRKIPFDVLVMAVGVRPNIEIAKDAGIACDRGIDADDWGHTSDPDVFAAGDCAKSFDITTGEHKILALLPNAYMQGERAGAKMSGGKAVQHPAIPMNAMGLWDMHIITAGSMIGESHLRVSKNSYKRLATQDDRLMGYILIGDVERAGIYTALIREQTPLHTIDFALMLERPQLMAFSKRERALKLGGERV